MKKIIVCLLAALLLLAACGGKTVDTPTTDAPETTAIDAPATTEAEEVTGLGDDQTVPEPAGRGDGGEPEDETTTMAAVTEPEYGWVEAYFDWQFPIGDGEFDSFAAADSEYAQDIVFSSTTGVTDFKFLELYVKDVGENGITYLTKELYTQPRLSPGRPLVVTLAFIGDTPNNGICYTDPLGETHYYSIGTSGMDGSLILTEF